MQTPADIFEDAYSYIFIVFAGTGATVLYNLLASVIDIRIGTPLIYLIIASIINIALDVVLIAVCRWAWRARLMRPWLRS